MSNQSLINVHKMGDNCLFSLYQTIYLFRKKKCFDTHKEMTKCNSQKNGIFSGTNYNRFNFMERPRDVQVSEHRNTDAIDFCPCSVQGFGFSSINTEN